MAMDLTLLIDSLVVCYLKHWPLLMLPRSALKEGTHAQQLGKLNMVFTCGAISQKYFLGKSQLIIQAMANKQCSKT